ncbi:MAG TPA: cohesin domain-containing protein [Saprospiraceae bacterium]|nr:cohesin domain-containing protein [Saprospiraceae bacterium]
MSNCLRTLCLGTCLLLTSRFYALPGVALPVLNQVTVGATVEPTVSLTGLSNLAAAQFVIVWNPQVLHFQSVENFQIPGMDASHFGMAETAQGILRFGWAGTGTGVSLNAEQPLFDIRFQVVGPNLSGSALTITEVSPTAFELIEYNGAQYVNYTFAQAQVTSGFVAVGYTVSAAEAAWAEALPVAAAPNPFHDFSAVTFDLSAPTELSLAVCDAAGRLIYTEMRQASAGPQRIEVLAERLPAAGTYFLTVRTPMQSCTQPLFFL